MSTRSAAEAVPTASSMKQPASARLTGLSEHETLGMRCVLERRDARFEEPDVAPRTAFDGRDELRFHHRGLSDNGEEAPPGRETRLEALREQRHRAGEQDDVVRTVLLPAARGVPGFERDIAYAVRRELFRRAAREVRNDVDAEDVRAERREQRGDVSGAGPDFEDAIGPGYGELLHHARLELGLKHLLAVADRDFHVD